MAVTRIIKVDTDISQTIILEKISQYLLLKNRDKKLAHDMKSSGHCMGFTVLALYAMYVELILKPACHLPCDDWRWLKSTLTRLAKWDGNLDNLNKSTQSGRKLRRDTERLTSLIEYFQNSNCYEISSQMQVHKLIIDTQGLRFYREYTLAGIFTCHDFTKSIKINKRKTTLIDELIKENRLVLISSAGHVGGIIKFKDQYFYYDSNDSTGWKIFSAQQTPQLAEEIFDDNYSDTKKLLPFSIIILRSNKENRAHYPLQQHLLSALGHSRIINGGDENATTALYMAAEAGCRQSVRFYLKHPVFPLFHFVNIPCRDGDTPLHAAAQEGFSDVTRDLINAGANPNAINEYNWTPLNCAANIGHVNTVRILLESGANPDLNKDKNVTSLYQAVLRGNKELVKLLLAYHAKPNAKAYEGNAPLHEAVRKNQIDIVQLLIANGASINVKNRHGCTVFHETVEYNNFDMMEYLLDKPDIQIGEKEYEALSNLANTFSDKEQVQRCMAKAQPLYLIHLIRHQLCTQPISRKIRGMALHTLRETRKEIINDSLSPDEQMILIMQNLLPMLQKASQSIKKSFWRPPDLTSPVLKFAKRVSPDYADAFHPEQNNDRCAIF